MMILDPTCCKFEISLNSLEMFGEGDGKGCRKKWIMKPMTISTPNYGTYLSPERQINKKRSLQTKPKIRTTK